MAVHEDQWTNDSFIDLVERTLIAMHETKPNNVVLKSSYLNPIQAGDIAAIRKHGAIIPAPDRICLTPANDFTRYRSEAYQFLTLPRTGCISQGAYTNTRVLNTDLSIASYCRMTYFRRLSRLPPGWEFVEEAVPYEVISTWPHATDGVIGVVDYLTVNQKEGRVIPCLRVRHMSRFGAVRALARRLVQPIPTDICLGIALQTVEDMDNQWRITAIESGAKVTVGAYAENVKSLLFARSLPMTPSGRKRPILHVVSAHRRRMQSGTDIDIEKFLRGTREIEMGGTVFKVDAPMRLINELLDSSAIARASTEA